MEVVEDSETGMPLSGHGLGLWLCGHSGLGKDNLINIINRWMVTLSEFFKELPCMTTLDVGDLSYQGLLESLLDGKSPKGSVHWLTWTNSEMSQCISTDKNRITERHVCQLAENRRCRQEKERDEYQEESSVLVSYWHAN